MNKLLPYQKEERLELGIDEAGRGCWVRLADRLK